MDRRQYLVATGTVLSTSVAGCLGGGNEDSGPDEPYIVGVNVQTSPQIRVEPQIRNPTDESVDREVWVRVASTDGGTLATRSFTTNIDPTPDNSQPVGVPFIFNNVAWSGTEVDTENTEGALTAPDADSPF